MQKETYNYFLHNSGGGCQQKVWGFEGCREPGLGGGAQATTTTQEISEGEESSRPHMPTL